MRVCNVFLEHKVMSAGGGGYKVEHFREEGIAFVAQDEPEVEQLKELSTTHEQFVLDSRINCATGYVSLSKTVEYDSLPHYAQIAWDHANF